jgi:hypothetical protein
MGVPTSEVSYTSATTYRVLVGRPDRKSPVGRHRCKWEGKIQIGLQEIGWGGNTELIWLIWAGSGM